MQPTNALPTHLISEPLSPQRRQKNVNFLRRSHLIPESPGVPERTPRVLGPGQAAGTEYGLRVGEGPEKFGRVGEVVPCGENNGSAKYLENNKF